MTRSGGMCDLASNSPMLEVRSDGTVNSYVALRGQIEI